MVSQLLASPQFAAFVTGLVLTVVWQVFGRVGRFLETQGAARGLTALIVIGKQLEAIGYDGDKLKGKPGAPEVSAPPVSVTVNTDASATAINDAVTKAVKDAINKAAA